MNICTVDLCFGPVRSRSLCSMHYIRWYRYGDPLWVPPRHWAPRPTKTALQRFWDKVNTTGDCWVWTGQRSHGGYGIFSANGKPVRAHRYLYEVLNGLIPAGLVIRHTCDNPPCIRPEHLLPGTLIDNARDSVDRGRNVHGDTHPRSKLSDEKVRKIRELKAAGLSHRELADFYGVSSAAIAHIFQGITWKHVH